MSQSRTKVRGVTVRSRTPLAQVQDTKNKKTPVLQQPTPKEIPAPPMEKSAPGFGERMLRNTAICAALLLCVVAVQNLNIAEGNETRSVLAQVVSMDISESLGSLKFVSNLIPESVAVFWNLGSEKHGMPTDAEVVHTFSTQEPWTVYGAGEAKATAPGEIMSVSMDAAGRGMVRVRHASGMETLYGNLVSVSVAEGDWVEADAPIGAAKALHYELRGEGRAMDPTPFRK